MFDSSLHLRRMHRVTCDNSRDFGLPPSHPSPYVMVHTFASA